MYGCCVLLHFVLTRCMRLLGNSPYAPFIYNSTANAGHAGPHPRSVIRLRTAPKRRSGWNSGTVLIKRAHAKAFGFRVHAYSATAAASFPFFSCADPHQWPHRDRSWRLVRYNACLVISSDHTIYTTERNICIIFW